MLIFPHRKSHMVHHTKCNTEEDPDIYARGSFGVVTFWHLPLATLGMFNPLKAYESCIRFNVTDAQRWFSMATFAAYTALAAWIIYAGYGVELLTLWFIPFVIGYCVMLIFFTWVPHHPHTIISHRPLNPRLQWIVWQRIADLGEKLIRRNGNLDRFAIGVLRDLPRLRWVCWDRSEPIRTVIRDGRRPGGNAYVCSRFGSHGRRSSEPGSHGRSHAGSDGSVRHVRV